MGASMPSGGSRRASRRHRGAFSEINVTPFVDVMLVLLVVFMISAPLLTTGVPLDLPKGVGQALDQEVKMLNISVDSEGVIYLGKDEVSLETLVPRLETMTAANPEMRLIISGDRQTPYGRIVLVMGYLKEAGFTKVGLKTEKYGRN